MAYISQCLNQSLCLVSNLCRARKPLARHGSGTTPEPGLDCFCNRVLSLVELNLKLNNSDQYKCNDQRKGNDKHKRNNQRKRKRNSRGSSRVTATVMMNGHFIGTKKTERQ